MEQDEVAPIVERVSSLRGTVRLVANGLAFLDQQSSAIRAVRQGLDWQSLRLLLSGSGILLVAIAYLLATSLVHSPLAPKRRLDTLGDWRTVGACFAASLLIAFGSYITAWRLAARLRPTPARIALVGVVGAIAGIILWPTYPILSDDLFYSIFGGRILAQYHQNPFLVPPAHFFGDPFLRYTGWTRLTMPYGPLWALLSGGLSLLAGDSLLANLLAFKGVALLAYLAATVLIGIILSRLHPERLLPGLVLWAWNPLVLVEGASNGHNDLVMVALILLAVVFALHERPLATIVSLVLAIALKYVAIVLLPLLLIVLTRNTATWRDKIWKLVPGLLTAIIILALLFVPFWVGWRTLGLIGEGRFYYGSPVAVIHTLLRAWDGAIPDWVPRALAFLLYGACYPLLLRQAAGGPVAFLRASYLAILLTLLGWPFFMPWYVLWVAALAAVLGTGRIPRQFIAFSTVAAASYLFQYSLRQTSLHSVGFWSVTSASVVFGTLLLMSIVPWPPGLHWRRARQLSRAQSA